MLVYVFFLNRNVHAGGMLPNGYPQMTHAPQDLALHGLPPYGKGFTSGEHLVKTESENPQAHGYNPNGGYPIADPPRSIPFLPPNYPGTTFSSGGITASSSLDHQAGLPPQAAYDQFRIAPPVPSDENSPEYWGEEEQPEEQYKIEPPSKRVRYSDEEYNCL